MKTTEKIENALRRIKELLTLVADWTKQPKEPDTLTLEFNKKKQQMIDDLYVLSEYSHFSGLRLRIALTPSILKLLIIILSI